MRRSFAIALLSLLSFSLFATDPSQAITPQDAENLVIQQVITPDPLEPQLVAFFYQMGLPSPALTVGQTVESVDGLVSFTATEPTYFIWIDREATFEWYHQSRFVFVTEAAGIVTTFDSETWPIIDGSEYEGFTDSTGDNFYGAYPALMPPPPATAPPVSLTKAVDPNACALIAIGKNRDGVNEKQSRQVDTNRIVKYLQNNPRGPELAGANIKTERGPQGSLYCGASIQDVCTQITNILQNPNCKKFYFFYAGHGSKGSNASMVFRGANGGREPMTYAELGRKILNAVPLNQAPPELCIVIEACYSGSVVKQLKDVRVVRNGKPVGLKVSVISSSSSDQVTERFGDGSGTPFYLGLEICSADLQANLNGDSKISLSEAIAWARAVIPQNATRFPRIEGIGVETNVVFRGSKTISKEVKIKDRGKGKPRVCEVLVGFRVLIDGEWENVNKRFLYLRNASCTKTNVPRVPFRITCEKFVNGERTTVIVKDKISIKLPPKARVPLIGLPADCIANTWKIEVLGKNGEPVGKGSPEVVETRYRWINVPRDEDFLIYEDFAIVPGESHTNDLGVTPPFALTADPVSFTDIGTLDTLNVAIRGIIPPPTPGGTPFTWSHFVPTSGDSTEISYDFRTQGEVPGNIGAGAGILYEALFVGGDIDVVGGFAALDHSSVMFMTDGASASTAPGAIFDIIEGGIEADDGASWTTDFRGDMMWNNASLSSPANGLRLDSARGGLSGVCVMDSEGPGLFLTGDLSMIGMDNITLIGSAGAGVEADGAGLTGITGLLVVDSGTDDIVLSNGTQLVLLDSYYDDTKVSIDATSALGRLWSTSVQVLDASATELPVAGATVDFYRLEGGPRVFVDSKVTDVDGVTDTLELEATFTDISGSTDLSNYEIDVTVGVGPGAATITIPYRAEDNNVVTLYWDAATGTEPPRQPISALRLAPNPFNPKTTVSFELATGGNTTVTISNARGERVKVLHAGVLGHGEHRFDWNGRDDSGQDVASGVYYFRLETASGPTQMKKGVLVR